MEELSCLPYHDNCNKVIFDKLISALKFTSKVYLVTHGAPIILFKFKELMKRPVQVIKKYIDSVLRSMGFLTGYIMTCRIFHCFVYSKLLKRMDCKFIIKDLYFIKVLVLIIQSYIGTSLVLLEDSKRINDYAVFTFPRVIEGVWYLFKKLTNSSDIPNFSKILFSLLIGIIYVIRKFYSVEAPIHYLRQFEFFFGK